MIDIHCHILCGLDDGPSDMNESLAMARIAVADGIHHIIATPHFTLDEAIDRRRVERSTNQLQDLLNEQEIPLKVYPGNEVRLESKDFIHHHFTHDPYAYLDSSQKYLLLEQPWRHYDRDTPEIVHWFAERGTQAILPHPERHSFFREQPELIVELIEAGMWTQITVDSLIGKNGTEVQQFAEWLVQNNMVHTLATDAHNVNRSPNLSDGYAAVRKLKGDQKVEEIQARIHRILFPE
ncbi:tyrosine-protein phosphatase [Paenibacillus chungangensis]|uniref:Tyrosine-protein phosphatase n=1 Tax=Paenibacillus chungangensis TaxID=696535 RepID=A0ABW3HWY0_9BACL